MARGPRLDAPGVIHHVMVRGLEGRSLFRDDLDREDLLRRLEEVLPECSVRCFAWALIPNHFHLVLQTRPVRLSRVMARIDTGYALYFNRRYHRKGFLFQNRFRSRIVRDEADLAGVVRYVHANPVRHGIVESPEQLESYRWAGHAALMGHVAARPFQSIRETLQLFGTTRPEARDALRRWFHSHAESDAGDSEMDIVRKATVHSHLQPVFANVRKFAMDDGDLATLIASVCRGFGIAERELRTGSRRPPVSDARAVVVHLACTHLGVSGACVARELRLSRGAVSRALRRGRRIAQADETAEHAAARNETK